MANNNPDDEDNTDTDTNNGFTSINDMYVSMQDMDTNMRIDDADMSDRIEITLRCVRVASEMNDIATYIEQNEDMDFEDTTTFFDGSFEDRAVMFGVGVVGESIEDFIEAVLTETQESVADQYRVDGDDGPLY